MLRLSIEDESQERKTRDKLFFLSFIRSRTSLLVLLVKSAALPKGTSTLA